MQRLIFPCDCGLAVLSSGLSYLVEMAGVARKELLHLVPKLTELQLVEVTAGLDLKLAKPKKDRKEALQNLLVRHISSEEVEDSGDEGLALYTQLLAQLKDLIQEDEEEKVQIKTKLEEDLEGALKGLKKTVNSFAEGGGNSDSNEGTTTGMGTEGAENSNKSSDSGLQQGNENSTKSLDNLLGGRQGGSSNGSQVTTEFHRIKLSREFKISNGTVGGEGSLDYSDLISRIREGVEMGYGEKEVMAGVVRAAKPGSELRKYLVRHPNMTFSDFKDTLREFYNVKESQSIMDEMRDMVQGPTQPLLKYVMIMCAMRDEVLEVMKGEEEQIGEPLVRKRFVEFLLSGLRKPIIRLEMQAVLKLGLSDPKLFKEVNLITARDAENERKLEESVKASVKVIDVDGGKKRGGRSKDDDWRDDTSAKIEALTAQVSKLEGLITQVATLNGNPVTKATGNDPMEQRMADLLVGVQHLTAQMQEYQSPLVKNQVGAGGLGGNGAGQKRVWFKYNKCNACDKENKPVCPHCRKCGEEGHKKAECPKN